MRNKQWFKNLKMVRNTDYLEEAEGTLNYMDIS